MQVKCISVEIADLIVPGRRSYADSGFRGRCNVIIVGSGRKHLITRRTPRFTGSLIAKPEKAFLLRRLGSLTGFLL